MEITNKDVQEFINSHKNLKPLATPTFDRINTHIVIKRLDAITYLTDEENMIFNMLYQKIVEGRKAEGKPEAEYYICNKDEPYAEEVIELIKKRDSEKNNQIDYWN